MPTMSRMSANRREMPIRALLFDLDNTLYPSTSGVTEALEARMNAYVQRVTGLALADAQALRQHYFVTYGTTLRGLQLHHAVDVEAYLADVHQLDIASLVHHNQELGRLLGADTRTKVIFTNSPAEHAVRVLAALGIADLALPIVDIRAMHFVPKPQLDAYHVAVAVTGHPTHEIAFFEDTLHNLAPAKAFGMTTVYIGTLSQPHPDYVDWCFPDIMTALTQLSS